MKAEFKEKFFEIPFGRLSGISTSSSSLIFLFILIIFKKFGLDALSIHILFLIYAFSFLVDGFIFNLLVQKQVDVIHRMLSPESRTRMNSLILSNRTGYLAFDVLPELLLVRHASAFGLTPFIALSLLLTAKIAGGQLLSLVLDRVPYKVCFGISIFSIVLSILLLLAPGIPNQILGAFTIHIVICIKGSFGSLSTIIRSNMALNPQGVKNELIKE